MLTGKQCDNRLNFLRNQVHKCNSRIYKVLMFRFLRMAEKSCSVLALRTEVSGNLGGQYRHLFAKMIIN